MRVIPFFSSCLTCSTIVILTAIALTGCQTPSRTSPNTLTETAAEPQSLEPSPSSPVRNTTTSTLSPSSPASASVALKPLPPETSNTPVQAIVDRYLANLESLGFDRNQQSVWVQTDDRLLAQWQGLQRLPAASVTKIATTLTALRVLGADRRFTTEIGILGTVSNGVLNGDLVVVGDRDPMFIWEDAIAIGNELNAIGIRQVTGDLIVVGDFFMNFEEDRATSAELLAIGLDVSRWTTEARSQHATLEPGTPQPQITIGGRVRLAPFAAKPTNLKPLLSYASRPLVELLDQMNRYSNNIIAHILADTAGGARALEQEVITATGINPSEIQFSNGSGLGRENQLSPRAAVMLFPAIARELAPTGLTVADVVAVAGVDAGILLARPLPNQSVLKSGSLNAVSTIAGGIPTANGVIWFAVMNGGGDTEALRSAQEALIAELEAYGGKTGAIAPELARTPNRNLAPILTRIP